MHKGDSWLIKVSVWRPVGASSLMNLLVAFEQQSKIKCRIKAEQDLPVYRWCS